MLPIRRVGLRRLAQGLCLIPGLFFLEHWGPDGLPSAQGCTGGAPPVQEEVHLWPDAAAVGLATDGFFLLATSGVSEPASLVPKLAVSVTTLDGVAVEGKLLTLSGRDQDYLAWQADAPLAVGTELKIVVEGPNGTGAASAADEAILKVTGEPAELQVGALSFGNWVDYRHGIGEPVTCKSLYRCGGDDLRVFAKERALPAVDALWGLENAVHGFTLWEVDVAASDPTPGLPVPPTLTVTQPNEPTSSSSLVPFSNEATTHCVTVSVKDLRSGAVESAERCTTREAPSRESGISRDFPLGGCAEPPSTELTAAWCEATSTPTSVCSTTPGEGVGSANGPPPTNDAETPARTSSGCQMVVVGLGAASGTFGGFGSVLAVLSLAMRRRARAAR